MGFCKNCLHKLCCNYCGKLLCWLVTILIVGIGGLALYTALSSPGGSASLSSTDVRILTGGISTVWCEGQTIQSDGHTFFNASVLFDNPRINPNIRHKRTMKVEQYPLTPDKPRVFWRFYLNAGSKITVSQCAKTTHVMSYIFRGHDVVEHCVNGVTNSCEREFEDCLEDSLERRLGDPCAGITLQRFLTRSCGGKMQSMGTDIANTDYYLVLYQSSVEGDTYITSQITLDTPTYDLSGSLQNCSSATECTLRLKFASDDVVVASLFAANATGEVELKWACKLRGVLYIITFLVVPVLFIILILGCVFYCYRKKAKKERCESLDPSEPPHVDSEKEPLLGGDMYEPPTMDPRLRDMGPIPGPARPTVAYPTAPPHDEEQPFRDPEVVTANTLYPEAPPTYEETMQRDEVCLEVEKTGQTSAC